MVVVAALATACGSASTNVVSPTAQKCQISVTDFTRSFGAGGGNGTASINAERECSWSASTQSSWISIATTQGTGSGTVTFRVAPNQAPQARSGDLAVNSQQLTVSQEAAPCRFAVSPASVQVAAAGGTASVSVSAMSGCAWTASSQASWIVLAAGGGNGNGSIAFSVSANPGSDRTGAIVVAGQTVAVAQAAAPPAPVPPTPQPPAPPSCQFAVAPSSLAFPAGGGEASLQVTTTAGCPWNASASASWLTVTPSAGTNSATVTVTAAANTDANVRTAAITIADQSVQVAQDAAAPGTPVELSGDLTNLHGDCPTLSFLVQGVAVVTDSNTVFNGKPCSKLKNGQKVVVDGLQRPGQPVLATKVVVVD